MDTNSTDGPLSCPAKAPAALRSLLGRTNRDWWPNQLNIQVLHQRSPLSDPMGEGWFLKVRPADPKQLDGLMDEAAYRQFVEEQH